MVLMQMHESGDERADPDRMSRPVMAGRTDFVTGPSGMALVDHHHRMAQMVYVARGVLTCEVSQGLWIVPPQCAVWIPGGTRHVVKGVGTIEVYSLFVDPASAPTMPDACCTVSVSSLLRELLLRFAGIPALYAVEGAESRLAMVLLDELAAAPIEKLHLPMPSDDRLRKIADAMAANPSDRASVQEWAERIEVSERTLSRLVLQETGMSFGRWRQQLHISLALQWLSQGKPVQSVATDLGYESASSFVFMFRKVLGSSPARYMTQRLAGSSNAAQMR
ncbi:AraC family transcriptional regulator [Singulisphaera acidiphila]|uniref:DNA-binding domain-containing protein, AraC-type n=1 Tax=Singulisphaera acidiphila (strain ATCC BAA-1392 / DSM 18658 / VKM B-2454 / MOB10) TaxID=886293 RepID=L0DR67_SINAD|nr:helix-turn-helix transcriptional regulator [Singulisphaera acidiphila]AGA31500.1 DNA-binding domain-containing protein, AraC-type [Singulisphaera acidiphila DSM 18658]